MLRRSAVIGSTVFLVTAIVALTATPAAAAWGLYNQLSSPIGAVISTDSVADFNDSLGADDFVVPEGKVWSIESVYAPGSNGGPAQTIPGVNVTFYDDGGAFPGAIIASYVGLPSTTGPDNLTIPLDPAVTLPAGTYWISVQVDMRSLPEGNSWLWGFRSDPVNDVGVWYGLGSTTFEQRNDFRFKLTGTSRKAKPPASANIAERPLKIGRDGGVTVTVWARCAPGLQAFEFDAGVTQGSTFASGSVIGPPDVLTCDDLWHPLRLRVFPESGRLHSGPATVNIFLGVFDPNDGDLDVTDAARVWLYRARPHHHL
jgi:hypothetical protein